MLTVWRHTFTPQSTEGSLSINGLFECWTLEPRRDQSQGKPYCVPAGVYDYIIQPSQRFGFDVPHILNVPGFDAIEIHPGNFPQDTHGCCLVGKTQSNDFVGHSREAFAALMSKIPIQGQVQFVDKDR